jgi:hypothetical protein
MRIITWHIPVAMLAGIALPAAILHAIDPAHYLDAGTHLMSGGAMLGAFFIATDYVTSPNTPRGQLTLRRRLRPADLGDPHLGRLPGRCCLRRAADEFGDTDHRQLRASAHLWPQPQGCRHRGRQVLSTSGRPAMQIGVAYSEAGQQVWLTIEVPDDAKVGEAIQKSGILRQFPQIDLGAQKVGVFGKPGQAGGGIEARRPGGDLSPHHLRPANRAAPRGLRG